MFLRLVEDGLELNPPSIPDGVIKLLAVELALDLGASSVYYDITANTMVAIGERTKRSGH